MTVRYTRAVELDVSHWAHHDRTKLARVQRLVAAIEVDPIAGIGKPERLRGNLAGLWSRRIDQEHRLVYRVEPDDDITVVSARFHYES